MPGTEGWDSVAGRRVRGHGPACEEPPAHSGLGRTCVTGHLRLVGHDVGLKKQTRNACALGTF